MSAYFGTSMTGWEMMCFVAGSREVRHRVMVSPRRRESREGSGHVWTSAGRVWSCWRRRRISALLKGLIAVGGDVEGMVRVGFEGALFLWGAMIGCDGCGRGD